MAPQDHDRDDHDNRGRNRDEREVRRALADILTLVRAIHHHEHDQSDLLRVIGTRFDAIDAKLDQLITAQDDRAQAKNLKAEVDATTAALSKAAGEVPKP